MTTSNLDPELTSYTPSTGQWFKVTVMGLLPGVGWPMTVSSAAFRKVSGLSRTLGTKEIEEGGRNRAAHTLWDGPAKLGEVTLEYGFIHTTALWDWCRLVEMGGQFRKLVMIEQYGHGGSDVVRRFTLVGAWPKSWKASDLDATGGQMSVESLTLVYDDLFLGSGLEAISAATTLARASIETVEGTSLSVDFQFNPKQIGFTRNSAWSPGPQSQHADYPSLTVPSSALDSLEISNILFDESELWLFGPKVVDTVNTLYQMTLVQASLGTQPRPPRVSLKWKDFQFYGGLNKVGANYTLFDSSGSPIRAEVSLSLTGQVVKKGSQPSLRVSSPTSEGGGGGC